MTDGVITAATIERRREPIWGGRMGGLAVHPWEAARPRQYWDFTAPPNPGCCLLRCWRGRALLVC